MPIPSPLDFPDQRGHPRAAFTLTELLVVIAILGLTASLALPSFFSTLRRERTNAVALGVAGWLEEVRVLAAKEVEGDASAQLAGCSITIAASSNNVRPGDTIAASSDCNFRNPKVIVPKDLRADLKIAHNIPTNLIGSTPPESCALVVCAQSVTLHFTPRGMWSFENVEGVIQDLEIRIALADGKGPKRCVRMSSIIGSIDIGTGGDGDVGTACTKWGAI